jgi:transcriptional regulator with XRE-family HTH domain
LNDTIGTAIRLRRRALGMTQARLARMAGLDQPAVSRLESGSRLPPLPVLERVANALGLRVTIGLEPLPARQGGPADPSRR